MPFDKGQLTNDLTNALAIPVPEDDTKSRDTIQQIAAAMADGLEINSFSVVLSNEERIAHLESRVDELEKQAAEFQSFIDSLDARVETVETKVQNVGGNAAAT